MDSKTDKSMEGIALPLPPPIVCLCGSTRFKQAWIAENARFTGEGYIVLAVGLWGHHERVFPDAETKKRLDELHLRKIDLCEMVWVLDVGGYIGESTQSEIAYAEAHGKLVRYLSKEVPDYTEPVDPLIAALRAKEKAEGALKASQDFFGAPEMVDELKRLREEIESMKMDVSCHFTPCLPECAHAGALDQIYEKADNLLHAAALTVPNHIHIEGLKGGMEDIKKMAELRRRAGDAG